MALQSDADHIVSSFRQINADHWVIGHLSLRRRSGTHALATWHDDYSSWTVTDHDLAAHLPMALDSPYIRLVHTLGKESAVWSIGTCAFCKVKEHHEGTTPEAATLNFVRIQKRSFDVPLVLFSMISQGRSYTFLKRLPGRTLDAAWFSLSDSWRSRYVEAIVQACREMAAWKGDRIGGVDGQYIPEYYLLGSDESKAFDRVPANCAAFGMDSSDIGFCHADLGPTNLIVEDEPRSGRIGIIDFEIAGYLPIDWLRTKFRISSGLDLSSKDHSTHWRAAVQQGLGAKGFEDYSEAWWTWMGLE